MAIPGIDAASFVKMLTDPNAQIQPAGVDLTVKQVYSIEGKLVLGVRKRILPRYVPIPGDEGMWSLTPGVYKVMFNEVVEVPSDSVALCFPRSTLLRSGVILMCTVWDPGYVGRGEALLHVINPNGLILERNARVAQLVFIKLVKPPHKTYQGTYLGENLE